ncbi:MAG: MBL fold metallo-hydrolase [Sphingomonadaceae bacterium]
MADPEIHRPYASAEQVAPFVRRVLARNPSHFTYTGTQSYVVGDDRNVAVIDPGPSEGEHLDALIETIGDAKIVAICCTHTHRDHSPAAAPLAERLGAQVIGCAPLVLSDDGPRSDDAFDATYDPHHVLSEGEEVGADGWRLTAIATPGHTSNHLCFALDRGGAVFTGDHVMGWSTSVIAPPDGDMSDYMASLQKLYAREDDSVYFPAHGPQVDKPRQLVRGMIGHRRSRENQIRKLLAEGLREIEAMVPRMYKGVDERLWPAAGRSVLAHLIDMERREIAQRSGEEWSLAHA